MDTAPYVDICVTQRFRAPADRVFNAWIDPAMAGKWLFATASRPMSNVTIDARTGGLFRFEERRDGKGVVQAGKYIEIVRPRRLVFTLPGDRRRRSSTCVSVEIVERNSGCEVRLIHEGVLPDDAADTEGRWTGMLYGLGTILGRSVRRTP